MPYEANADFEQALERFRREFDLDELNIADVYGDVRAPGPGRDVHPVDRPDPNAGQG